MATLLAIPLFLGSIPVTLSAAAYFADRLDHIGPRLGLGEALVGLLTALAADGPEISTAIFALIQGEKAVSLGVVLGSNAFNIAAMVGLSAVITGAVRLTRTSLLLEGSVGALATLIAVGLILGLIDAAVAAAALAALLVPYVVLLTRVDDSARKRPRTRSRRPDERALWKLSGLALLSAIFIVLGSAGMVKGALTLAEAWGLSKPLVGVTVLAVLTSLPNAFTAGRLAVDGRGSALVSETLNSNTLNLVGAVIVPALVVGLGAASGLVKFDLAWLILMTGVMLALLFRRGGSTRAGGMFLIALYLAFVVAQLIFTKS